MEGHIPRIVQLLVEPRCPEIQRVASGNKQQTQLIVDSDAIEPMKRLLRHSDLTVRRETTFSNVLAGSTSQNQIGLGVFAKQTVFTDVGEILH